MITLNDSQLDAVDKAYKWFKEPNGQQVFSIVGPAGTGKTTIISALIERLDLEPTEVLFMAYVGKAAMVLSLKGNYAKTIHSSIYELTEVQKYDENGYPMMKNGRPVKKKDFVLKETIGRGLKLLVIDEASMVNEKIGKDVLSFNIPVIALGDLNQLPPVFGKPYFLNHPDVILTEVMRQAKDNPIVFLANKVLNGEELEYGIYGDNCAVIPKEKLSVEALTKPDVILCAKNFTREKINSFIRKDIKHVTAEFPMVGDKVICRKNNWSLTLPYSHLSLINGMIGYLTQIRLETYKRNSILVDFKPDFIDETFKDIELDPNYMFMSYQQKKAVPYSQFDLSNKFEIGYAITVHLSQGSQFDNVLLFDEPLGDKQFHRSLLYTGITRAVKGLVIVK